MTNGPGTGATTISGRQRPTVAAVLAAWALVASVVVTSCATGCPTALLEGTLVAADGELVVEGDEAGVATHVQWPFGVGVRRVGDELVVSDALGTIKAREGDTVGIGGSSTDDGGWVACGDITVIGARDGAPPPAE